MGRWLTGGMEEIGLQAMALSTHFAHELSVPTHYRLRHVEGGAFMVATWLPCDDECLHLRDGKQRVLTVHHLDGDKSNCRWWNLAALCQADHLKIQAQVIMAQTYQLPHTDWFKPYVAGFYAFTLMGEDLSREAVMDRLDELLLVGQPHMGEDRA